jgi:hypothetical protein
VVDSDDWLDAESLTLLLAKLRHFIEFETRVDLVISNYVYEHVEDAKQIVIDYHHVLPRGKIFTWDKIGHFSMTQNLLMHSLCYRTDVLRDGGVPMPAHTFYVDNIYAYVPLPRCKTIYYLDVDLYRYFIGREDQSVNEAVMIGRIDQQLRITRIMMKAYHLYEDVEEPKLRSYMLDYFTLMMAVSSIFSKMSEDPEAIPNMEQLWADLKEFDPRMHRRARMGVVGMATNLPGEWGKKTITTTQHILGCKEDGIMGEETIKAIQKKVGAEADGFWGTGTSKAMQKFLGVEVDGERGPKTVKAWQEWCNKQLG